MRVIHNHLSREDPEMPERTCPNCGETVPDANYCAKCGGPMPEVSPDDKAALEPPVDMPCASEDVALPPPPPPEEAAEPAEAAQCPELTGGEQSAPDIPPSEPPVAPDSFDAASAEIAEEAPERPLVSEPLEPRGMRQEPSVAGAAPLQQAAVSTRTPASPADGQLRCPACGEAVYADERVCWNCSRRLETLQQAAEVVPEQGVELASGAPVRRDAPAQPPRQPDTPVAARRQQPPTGGKPSDQAMSFAWWSFGLGLLSVFTCGILGLLGIVSVWLGVSAARRGAGPVAIAGVVFGAIGLLIFLAWGIGLAIAMPEMLRPGATHILLPSP